MGCILWLMCIANVCLKPGNGILLAPQTLGDVGSHTYALIICQFHDPPCVPNIVLFQVDVLQPLRVPQVFELVRRRSGESLRLRVVHDAAVVERLQQLVNVVRLVASLELDRAVLSYCFVHALLNDCCFALFF